MELAGQVAVVTGGGRGIGRAIVSRFLEAGATVVLGDVDGARAEACAVELSPLGPVTGRALDVRDWGAVGGFYGRVADEHGRLDISVNNAGVTAIGPSLEMREEQWAEVVAVNLSGVFACAQAAGRIMTAAGRGSIISMASAAGVLALPGRAPYCSTKAAVIGLTKVLAVEWASQGVRVNAIGPGWVMTDLVRAAIDAGNLSVEGIRGRTPLDRLGEMTEVAEVALFLASSRSSYLTGQTIFPDGGFSVFGGWK